MCLVKHESIPVVVKTTSKENCNFKSSATPPKSPKFKSPPDFSAIWYEEIKVNREQRRYSFIIFAMVLYSPFTDVRPTDNNVNGSCSAVLDRNTISYDVTFYITFDETFTPAVISAINVLRVTRFEIDSNGNVIPGTVLRVNAPLDSSVEQGPVTVGILYQDLPQLLDRHGYSLHVSSITHSFDSIVSHATHLSMTET